MSFSVQPSGVPLDRDTVTRVQRGVAELLAADFGPRVLVDDDTVARIFQRVLSERREPRDRVIERCIMELSNEFKTTELEKQKHLKWERAFWHVGSAYDSSARMSGGDWTVKYSAQPSTLNFYHSVGGSFQ